MTPAEDGSLPFGIEAPTCGAAIDREDVLPVAIIGAGIGGLALAVALEHAKVPFAVYERDLCFEQRKQGYGMTLTPSGLRGLGIEKACRAASQTSCRHWVLSGKEGTILGYFGRGLEVEEVEVGGSTKSTWGDEEVEDSCSTSASEGGPSPERSLCGRRRDERADGSSSSTSTATAGSGAGDSGARKTDIKPPPHQQHSSEGSLRIPRERLRRILLDRWRELRGSSCATSVRDPVEVQWGMRLLDIETVCSSSLKVAERPEQGAERESEKLVAKLTFWKEEEGKEVTQYARLVVGADGIRSRVRGLVCSTNENQLSSLGVSVIVGLSHASKSSRQEADARTVETGNRAPPAPGSASLIRDGGFYALDDRKRLFVMPYSDELTMWQLSFYDRDGSKILCGTAEPAPAAVGTATTKRTGTTPSDYLKSLALDLVADWFPLCTHLVEETANETIWGTALFDSAEDFMRPSSIDGASLLKPGASCRSSVSGCVTLLGDAAHPMSMFKGQGCNQALLDAQLLAKCLAEPNGGSQETRLKKYWREMRQRAAGKVLASREACNQLHREDAGQLLVENTRDAPDTRDTRAPGRNGKYAATMLGRPGFLDFLKTMRGDARWLAEKTTESDIDLEQQVRSLYREFLNTELISQRQS